MNKQIRFLGLGLMVCFLALFVQLNRVQIFQQEALQTNPNNTRAIVRNFGRERGSIFTADGVVIATSVEVDSELERERTYPEGELYAHSTGFFSFQFGADGLERVYNDQLAGQTEAQQFSSLSDLFRDTDTTANLTVTLNSAVQSAARTALGDRNGSVVVLDPRTGDILAMWSYPSYDPSVLGSTDLTAAEAAWEMWGTSPEDPRLPKAYRELFFPGSTFKVVTAAAAISSGRATMTEPEFEVRSEYTAPLTTVPLGNFGGNTCGGNLLEALRQSCNTAFAELAAEVIGSGPLIETAERFGFNDVPPFDLPGGVASNFPTDYGVQVDETDGNPPVPILENTPALAQAGIGQNDVKATPLQMALVAAGVANNGVIREPHLMKDLRDQTGELIEAYDPVVWRSPLSTSDARVLQSAMEDVVQNGTAQRLAIAGFTVGGKTGTAQVDASRPDDTHGWIIGYAGPEGQPATVAIAVVIESVAGEGQLTGGSDAAPIARDVLIAALRAQGFDV